MCGIAGELRLDGRQPEPWLLDRMHEVMAHRGPDGSGSYLSGPIGLTHRRLSIIDLSAAAAQPMGSETGEVTLIYNGEIFNFAELRDELSAAGHVFRSRTDSEVLIHGYEEWGRDVVKRAKGMFAFALWDAPRQRLVIARDRFGVKPLYWYRDGQTFLFASEIKAILAHPDVRRGVSYAALNEYFSFQNVLTDLTLFEGIRLLPPASILTIGPSDDLRIDTYWDYPFSAEPLQISQEEAAEETHRLFVQAVERQLVSDVPVGAYLSGGMDSGSIARIAGGHLDRLRTFTAGFDLSSASGMELGFDERKSAEFMSNVLKTEHYEVVLHAGDMEHVLPELIWHLEDLRVGQCYPNYYVARLASRFVKVVLSGAGGDELFAGYPWRYYRGVGSTDRNDYMERYYQFWQRLVPDHEKRLLFNEQTLGRIGEVSTFDQFRGVFDSYDRAIDDTEGYVAASLYFELKTFLPGLLLVEDKLSMAHSLETRVPFLDEDLVEFAVRLPARHKLRDLDSAPRVDENVAGRRVQFELETSEGKTVLREAMAHIIPPEVARRTKQGFSAPDASWFRGESIDYISQLLHSRDARIYEYLDPTRVQTLVTEHSTGRVNHRLLIWSLLSFEWWLRTFFDSSSADGASDVSEQVRQLSANAPR